MRKFGLVVVVALLLSVAWLLWPKPDDTGKLRFWQGALFDWLGKKFPSAPTVPAKG